VGGGEEARRDFAARFPSFQHIFHINDISRHHIARYGRAENIDYK
jgi:hypothetical protein